ncbi:hypothetical protein HanRHA438_Chr17g0834301 [Helianthus annuus]|nr:hypothetical protein HanRHA438_Chr17g0834301 [Helianthus annuus]
MVRLEESYFMVICILLGVFLASHQCNLQPFIGRKNLTDIEAFGVSINECVKKCTYYQAVDKFCCCHSGTNTCAYAKEDCHDKCHF